MRKWIAVVVLGLGMPLWTGCASIGREECFTPCKDPNCPKCHGTGTYRCVRCMGRGVEICDSCQGRGQRVCSHCKGAGMKDGKQCKVCGGRGYVQCPWCDGTGKRTCRECKGDGMVRCGTTTYTWVCRKCGRRFNYPAKLCPDCDKKEKKK